MVERFHFKIGLLSPSIALFAAVFLAGCGVEDAPKSDAAPRETGAEWFWRDRLARRPEPLPPPSLSPDIAGRIDSLFRDLEGLSPHTLADRIAELAALGPAAGAIGDRIDSPERNARYLAAAALGRVGGLHAQEPLLRALRDDWSAVAVIAADGLGSIGEPWVMPRLIKAVGPYPVDFNPHLMVRVKAARALLNLGNLGTVPFLIKILKENTPAEDPVREWDKTYRMAWEKEEALEALAGLAGDAFGFNVDAPRPRQAESALRFEQWWLKNRIRLWEQAPSLDDPLLEREIRDITAGLDTFQMRIKDGAHFMLRMLGPPVFPFLAEALEDDRFYVRFHTLEIIGELAPLAGSRAEEWAREVHRSLKDPAPAVRVQACRALGFLGRTASVVHLEELLSDPDGDVRLKAVEALGRIGGNEGERCLEDLMAGTAPGQLRVEILAALVRTSGRWTEEFLGELLSDDLARQEWGLQKVIDLTGDDFDFPLGGSEADRRSATDAIGRALRVRGGR